jgi:hypothetical protein
VRANQALELRIAGLTFRQIAVQLGVDARTAYDDVQTELGALDPVVAKQAERLRDLEVARLDRLWLALNPGIKAGQPGAVLAAVRVMERRAKLLGLDSAERVVLSGEVTLAEKIAAARQRGAQLKAARERAAG